MITIQTKISEKLAFLANSLFINLEFAKKTYNSENIHQFRVSVKKIRAVLRMVNSLFPESRVDFSALKNVRSIFKLAASLRDIQIIKSLISEEYPELEKFSAYHNFLNFEERKSKRVFKKAFSKQIQIIKDLVNIQNSVSESLANTQANQIIFAADQLITDKQNILYNLLCQSVSDKAVHKVRIKLKEIIHIKEITEKDTFASNLYHLKAYAQELGSWHDHIILLNYIDRFIQTKRKKDLKDLSDIFREIQAANLKTGKLIVNNLQKTLKA